MSHVVLLVNKAAADYSGVDNRSVYSSASNLDNGAVFMLPTQNYAATTGYAEVWDAVQPVSGSLAPVWMANSPEIVNTTSGNNIFRGIDPDPRNFYNPAGYVFDAFKPRAGDILTFTADEFNTVPSVGQFAYSQAGSGLNVVSTGSSVGTCLSMKCTAVTYISIGSGSAIGTSRVPAYKMEVISN